MPNILHDPPEIDAKSLTRRVNRGRRFLAYEQVEALPAMLKGLRKIAHGLSQDYDTSKKPLERVAIASAYARVSEQRRVLLRIPGPSSGSAAKLAQGHTIDSEPLNPSPAVPAPDPPTVP